MKIKKPGLVLRIAIAIALGLALGCIAPCVMVRSVNTFTFLFDQFIKFMVPLIIIGLVAPAIAETGSNAGKMLAATVAIAYCSTLLAGFLGYSVSAAVFPSILSNTSASAAANVAAIEFPPYVKIAIPPLADVMTALIAAFMLGLGMVFCKADALKRGFVEFRDIVSGAISSVLVPLLPFYIFGIFLDMSAAGKAKTVVVSFATIIAVFSVLTLLVILLQFSAACIYAKRNPFKAMLAMLPAYMTALGTSSSAATIPVTRAQTIKAGVRSEIADFVIPLCATVHLSGSTIKLVSCAIALLLLGGRADMVNLSTFSYFIAMIGVMMVAAPGVPGGAIMSALGMLESILGFDQTQIALMIAIYMATDSIGTACNITGDGAIAIAVDHIFRDRKRS